MCIRHVFYKDDNKEHSSLKPLPIICEYSVDIIKFAEYSNTDTELQNSAVAELTTYL